MIERFFSCVFSPEIYEANFENTQPKLSVKVTWWLLTISHDSSEAGSGGIIMNNAMQIILRLIGGN